MGLHILALKLSPLRLIHVFSKLLAWDYVSFLPVYLKSKKNFIQNGENSGIIV